MNRGGSWLLQHVANHVQKLRRSLHFVYDHILARRFAPYHLAQSLRPRDQLSMDVGPKKVDETRGPGTAHVPF